MLRTPRNLQHSENLEAAAVYIERSLEAHG
jgi:hypothetical protein